MNRINNNYAVIDFENDMSNFSQADIEAYEAGRVYAFPGSYRSESVFLRENSTRNVLAQDNFRNLTEKEKVLFSLCVIFSEQARFEELLHAGLTLESIAWAFKTTVDNVYMKREYDKAKAKFLEDKKVKSY